MKPALVMSIVCILTATVGAGQRQATTRTRSLRSRLENLQGRGAHLAAD